MIKLVVIDLDGTLLSGEFNKNISSVNKNTIKTAKEKGCKIVIATGRPIAGVLSVLEQLDMITENDYVIAYNGAIIYNVGTKKVINLSTITGKDVKELYLESKMLNVNFHAFNENEELITDVRNQYTDIECQLNEINYNIVDFNKIDDNNLFIKAMLISDATKLDYAMANINHKFKEKYTMIRSADIFLEFLDNNSDKGYAMLALAKYLKINTNEIMAIGDAGNDLLMIKFAGVGVAMSNAYDYVKEVADFVTLSNEEHGVAYAIKRFVIED